MSGTSFSRGGSENRFANDGSQNHIDRIRKQDVKPSFQFSRVVKKTCTRCGRKSEMKGSKTVKGVFVCAKCIGVST